jgi:hypothetical protein
LCSLKSIHSLQRVPRHSQPDRLKIRIIANLLCYSIDIRVDHDAYASIRHATFHVSFTPILRYSAVHPRTTKPQALASCQDPEDTIPPSAPVTVSRGDLHPMHLAHGVAALGYSSSGSGTDRVFVCSTIVPLCKNPQQHSAVCSGNELCQYGITVMIVVRDSYHISLV